MEDKNLIVPNIGEFKNVEVIEVLVNEGDFINKNDPLITIESDKSSCLLYTSPSPRDFQVSRMPSSA